MTDLDPMQTLGALLEAPESASIVLNRISAPTLPNPIKG